MTRTPDLLLRTPGRTSWMLSDVLRVVRLKGGVFLRAEFTAPWCIFSQFTGEDFGRLRSDVVDLK